VKSLAACALLLAIPAGACALAPRPLERTDIAVLEAGDANIEAIDRIPIRSGNNGAFELRPGSHTVDVTATAVRPGVGRRFTKSYQLGLVSLCLKARGGQRYRIRTVIEGNLLRAYVIDRATGEPPKTPCGPDEDEH
jgi:hypothetical protein